MSMVGFVMLKLFFLMNCVAGFLLMLLGVGMIEHPDLAVALVGALLSLIGIMSFIWFGILLAREEV